jgi:hypothetical protein
MRNSFVDRYVTNSPGLDKPAPSPVSLAQSHTIQSRPLKLPHSIIDQIRPKRRTRPHHSRIPKLMRQFAGPFVMLSLVIIATLLNRRFDIPWDDSDAPDYSDPGLAARPMLG